MIDIKDLEKDYPSVLPWNQHYAVVRTAKVEYFVMDLKNGEMAINKTTHFAILPQGRYLRVEDKETHKFGLRDEHWNVILPCEFPKIQDLIEEYGISRVHTGYANWGLIDKTGRYILKPEYYHISPIYPADINNLYVIVRERAGDPEKKIFISRDGNEIVGESHDNIPDFKPCAPIVSVGQDIIKNIGI